MNYETHCQPEQKKEKSQLMKKLGYPYKIMEYYLAIHLV